MNKLTLKAKLTSTGAVNNAYVYLEDLPGPNNLGAIAINLIPKDSKRKEWSNKDIEMSVDGNLEYMLKVHAIKGTSWEFTLTNASDDKEILKISGKTGSGDWVNGSLAEGSIPMS